MTTLASTRPVSSGWRWISIFVVAVWAAVAWSLADAGAFRDPPGQIPVSFLIAILAPVALFLALYRSIPSFRDFVLGWDLRALTVLQVSRVIGFAFLAFYGAGLLPGVFAWPAGVGDVLVGLAAAMTAQALVTRPAFATSRRFVAFHLLGLFDFVVAFVAGSLGAGVIPGVVDTITTAPLAGMPLALIPGFLVPIYIVLHLAALLQVGVLRRAAAEVRDPRQ